MHLDRADLQLLAFAARRTAYAVRADEADRSLWLTLNASSLERLAARLEDELVRRRDEAATPGDANPSSPERG